MLLVVERVGLFSSPWTGGIYATAPVFGEIGVNMGNDVHPLGISEVYWNPRKSG